MRRISLIIATLLLVLMTQAQSTPEDLGKEVFAAFQSQDLNLLDGHFPDPQAILAQTAATGIEFTEFQKQDFIINFPYQIQRYKMQCDMMLKTDLGTKVNWMESIYENSEKQVWEVPVALDSTKVLEATDVKIHFKDAAGKYTITLSECLELGGKWYLGGGQVQLSAWKE